MFYVAAWLLSVKANCFIVGMVTGTICYHPCASSFGVATRVQEFDPPTILTRTWKMNTFEGPKHAMLVLNTFESWIDSLGIILVSNQWLTGGLG